MESNESQKHLHKSPGSEEKRILRSLGQKLLRINSEKWSLREDDKELLEDMGVSFIKESYSSVSKTYLNESKENIENHSPNYHSLKRTHSKSNLSETKESTDIPIKISSPFKPSNSNINSLNLDAKLNQNIKCNNQSIPISSNISECSNFFENIKNDAESSSNLNLNFHKSERDSKQITDITKRIDSNNIHVSPLTDYLPLHKYPISITNDTNVENSELSSNTGHNKYNCNNKFKNSKIEKDSSNILSNEELENSHQPIEDSEKECFVVHDLSFCDANERKNSLSSPEMSFTPSQENENAFSKLFDELVLSIFQWLPKRTLVRCMLVCKRWYRLALDSRLWTRVCLGGKVINSGVLPNLMRRQPNAIRLANAQLISPVVSSQLLEEWRVQYLDISAASIAPECLAEILKRCRGLYRLSLEGLSMCESASAALGDLVNLRTLNLALTTELGMTGAKSLSNLSKIEALNVAWTRLDLEATRILCKGLSSSVLRLNVSGFRKTLTEELLEIIVSRCPNLVELDLSDCIVMGDNVISTLQNLRSLEHLALSRCNRLRKSDFMLLNEFPSLRYVDVFGLITSQTSITLNGLNKLVPNVKFNQFIHSAIARPTVGNRRTSIWGLRTRD